MVKTRRMEEEGKEEKGKDLVPEEKVDSRDAQEGPRALESGGVSRQEFMSAIGALEKFMENSLGKLSSQMASSKDEVHGSRPSEAAPLPSSAAQFSDVFRFNAMSTDGRVQSSPAREASSPDRFFPGFSPFSPSGVGNTNLSLPFGATSLPKRSENEVAILYQVMEAARDPDQVVRICKKRIQILYAAETLGWKEIQTYLQMFPGDAEINVSNLQVAVQMAKFVGSKNSGPVVKKSSPPESNYGASNYGGPNNYGGPKKKGNCFNCGGTGHWVGECPAPRKPKGN